VDPRIAFSLASRFPTNTYLKAEIVQLVQVCLSHYHESLVMVGHLPFVTQQNFILCDILNSVASFLQSHMVDIRCIPEALPYFVTPKAVDENSALLQQLPHWAACSITQALEFLTPAYKGHPRVMAYVLRVLESYPPKAVTFFMPQLVQALRYDEEVRYLIETFMVFFVSVGVVGVCTYVFICCIKLNPSMGI
jgi:phosphatidylinositol 4-kinase